MGLITRRRGNRPAVTEQRYAPDDTPYSYRESRREVKKLADDITGADDLPAMHDRESRLVAQVDLLRIALETIRATWCDADGKRPDIVQAANQRLDDQRLARYTLQRVRQLDDDRHKARRAALKAHR